MKAVTWHGKRDVRVESVPHPKILASPELPKMLSDRAFRAVV